MHLLRATAVSFVIVSMAACAPEVPPEARSPGKMSAETQAGGLFAGFRDGKYDTAGHPLGAQVFAAGATCRPTTGAAEVEGWGVWPTLNDPGALCDVNLDRVGAGAFTLSVRVLIQKLPPAAGSEAGAVGDDGSDAGSPRPDVTSDDASSAGGALSADALLTLHVYDADGKPLAQKTLTASAFRKRLTYRNLWVSFTHQSEGPLHLVLTWSGGHPVRFSYLELFRRARGVRIAPASGMVPGGEIRVEGRYPHSEEFLSLSCGDISLDAKLAALYDAGRARREMGDFRTLITVSASELLADCSLPTQLRGSLKSGFTSRATSRVTYRQELPSCAYVGQGTRVLLTAFEPFPAASSGENSSQAAVEAFDPASLPGVAVARVILPVEWDSAGAMVDELVDRCKPDIVIGFGQGRWRVEPEALAFNRQDTSDFAGGVPDNRGFVRDGQPVLTGAPAQFGSGLPISKIVGALEQAGIDASRSEDAGRYICNEVFFRIMHATSGRKITGGFVHLPQQYVIDEEARQELARIVSIIVKTTRDAL